MTIKNDHARRWMKQFEALLIELYDSQPLLKIVSSGERFSILPPGAQYPANWSEWEASALAEIAAFRKANPQPQGLPPRDARRLERDIERMLDPIADMVRAESPEAIAAYQEARGRRRGKPLEGVATNPVAAERDI